MITVRLAEPRDAADIQRIFERTLREADWLPKGADPDTDFLRNSGGETVYVGLSPQGEVAGFLSLYTPGKFIHHLYVEAGRQRQGVGVALLNSLESWLPKPWRLKCVTINTPARAFYARCGWVETETAMGSQGEYVLLRKFAEIQALKA